ncbi:MAG: hypothetical protein ACKO37_07320 [Vampirovibrionales bacterium]
MTPPSLTHACTSLASLSKVRVPSKGIMTTWALPVAVGTAFFATQDLMGGNRTKKLYGESELSPNERLATLGVGATVGLAGGAMLHSGARWLNSASHAMARGKVGGATWRTALALPTVGVGLGLTLAGALGAYSGIKGRA